MLPYDPWTLLSPLLYLYLYLCRYHFSRNGWFWLRKDKKDVALPKKGNSVPKVFKVFHLIQNNKIRLEIQQQCQSLITTLTSFYMSSFSNNYLYLKKRFKSLPLMSQKLHFANMTDSVKTSVWWGPVTHLLFFLPDFLFISFIPFNSPTSLIHFSPASVPSSLLVTFLTFSCPSLSVSLSLHLILFYAVFLSLLYRSINSLEFHLKVSWLYMASVGVSVIIYLLVSEEDMFFVQRNLFLRLILSIIYKILLELVKTLLAILLKTA